MTITKPWENTKSGDIGRWTNRIVYDTDPWSPSCFKGTPAEGRVPGVDRKAWLAEDWCGNVVGVSPLSSIDCPYLPGTALPEGVVSGVALVRAGNGWQWALDIAA